MCAIVTTVVDGNPNMLAVKSTLAVEMFPEASFVTLNTIVAVPEPTDSALVIGGVSFAGRQRRREGRRTVGRTRG